MSFFDTSAATIIYTNVIALTDIDKNVQKSRFCNMNVLFLNNLLTRAIACIIIVFGLVHLKRGFYENI